MFTPSPCPPHSVWLSLLHIYFFLSTLCIFQLPLSNTFSSFFHFFLGSSVPSTISFLFFNLDFHRPLFHLSHSDSLSLYFFWWRSLIFTSLCLTLSLSACTVLVSLWLAPVCFSSISIPPGWRDSTTCRVSPHQKANNEKRNVWRNPALSWERKWRRHKERKRMIKKRQWGRQWNCALYWRGTDKFGYPYVWMVRPGMCSLHHKRCWSVLRLYTSTCSWVDSSVWRVVSMHSFVCKLLQNFCRIIHNYNVWLMIKVSLSSGGETKWTYSSTVNNNSRSFFYVFEWCNVHFCVEKTHINLLF